MLACASAVVVKASSGANAGFGVAANKGFPSFLPREVENIRDPAAREMARRIQRVPVKISTLRNCIMSSCVRPLRQKDTNPIVLLHGFDSSCLEWSYSYPLLENAGVETWAVDILGWGFSGLEILPPCDAATKREHLYQLWRTYIRKPMILVGPSLGAAVAIDFATSHPEAVAKLVLIGARVYSEGVGKLSKLPRMVAYVGVSLLKSMQLRLFANTLVFKNMSMYSHIDWTNVGHLHCLQPWWEDATIDFMISGGYNVVSKIGKRKHRPIIIWGEEDRLVSNNLAGVNQNFLTPRRLIYCCMLWELWKVRNSVKIGGKEVKVSFLLLSAREWAIEISPLIRPKKFAFAAEHVLMQRMGILVDSNAATEWKVLEKDPCHASVDHSSSQMS